MRSADSGSETAQTIAALVRDAEACPAEAAQQLARLLAHSLASPSTADRREARLGLLIDLVSSGTGEFVRSEDYETERERRRARGEEWPAASSLSRAYGHWLTAVRAACRYWFDGGQSRVCSDHHHARPTKSYKPQEIRSALLQAQAELDVGSDGWPSEWEFYEWSTIKRRLARQTGQPCRLPGRKQIRKAFGSYANAVDAARRVASG